MKINPNGPLPAFTKGYEAKAYIEAMGTAPAVVREIDELVADMARLDGTSHDYDPRPKQVVFVDHGPKCLTGELQTDAANGTVTLEAGSPGWSSGFSFAERERSKTYSRWDKDGGCEVILEAGQSEWNFSKRN